MNYDNCILNHRAESGNCCPDHATTTIHQEKRHIQPKFLYRYSQKRCNNPSQWSHSSSTTTKSFLFRILIVVTTVITTLFLPTIVVHAKQQPPSNHRATKVPSSIRTPKLPLVVKKPKTKAGIITKTTKSNHVQHQHHEEELMSGPTAIANVLADLCPHGMLPIAFGMAAAGGTGPVLATIILILFGVLSWYSLISFARAAEATLVVQQPNKKSSTTGTTTESVSGESLSAVWEKIVPHGSTTKYIPDLGCVCLTVGCLLFYSAFIGDIFGSLISGITSIPNMYRKRWTILLLLHAIPILPLCLIKDLSALKYSSMTGLVGIVYTIVFVAIRLWDGSYAPGGKYHALMPFKFQPAPQIDFPSSTVTKSAFGFVADLPLFHSSKGLLILMNMCCVAYACHYNAVKYYMELKERTVPAFQRVIGMGIGGTALVFWCMMILGYGTFGLHSQTLLLNNYHPSLDTLATIARTFTGIAIISGYALMFAGYKAALFSLLRLDQPNVTNRSTKQNLLSFASLAIIAIAACFVTEHELGTVIGIVGSVFGSIVIYMFPAIINNNLLRKKDQRGKFIAQPFFRGEEFFNKIMMLFGMIFAVLGTWISLQGGEAH